MSHAPAWGVACIIYDPKTLQPLPSNDPLVHVAYDDPRIWWTLAAGDVISLHGCTRVDLADLASLENGPAVCEARR